MNSLLGYEGPSANSKEMISVVVIEKVGRLFGLEVDEIVDTISTDIEVDSSLAKQGGTFGDLSMSDQLIVVIDTFGIINLSFPELAVVPSVNDKHRVLKSSLKILLVEDSIFFRREMARILSSAGHEVSTAVDGVEALQILENDPTKIDIIVTDIEMPRMNGFELAKAVRAHQDLSSKPMVAISSKASKKYTDKGMEAGFDIYIEKLKIETLLGAVATLSTPRRAA